MSEGIETDWVEMRARGERRGVIAKDADGNPGLLYTSDAADDLLCGDLGCRRILKKKNSDDTTSVNIGP